MLIIKGKIWIILLAQQTTVGIAVMFIHTEILEHEKIAARIMLKVLNEFSQLHGNSNRKCELWPEECK